MALPIPTPDVPLADPATGLMTQEWFNYFRSRDRGASGASGGSNISAWFYGTGVPSNSLGIDGDFYMQKTGSTVTAFYVKSGGIWT